MNAVRDIAILAVTCGALIFIGCRVQTFRERRRDKRADARRAAKHRHPAYRMQVGQ